MLIGYRERVLLSLAVPAGSVAGRTESTTTTTGSVAGRIESSLTHVC